MLFSRVSLENDGFIQGGKEKPLEKAKGSTVTVTINYSFISFNFMYFCECFTKTELYLSVSGGIDE